MNFATSCDSRLLVNFGIFEPVCMFLYTLIALVKVVLPDSRCGLCQVFDLTNQSTLSNLTLMLINRLGFLVSSIGHRTWCLLIPLNDLCHYSNSLLLVKLAPPVLRPISNLRVLDRARYLLFLLH